MPNSREERLARDHREMMKIQDRPYLSWIVTAGEPPYAEEYLLSLRLRVYVYAERGGERTVGAVRKLTVRVTLRDSYPNVAPYIKILDVPPAFHPHWYSKGTYCPPEPWDPELSLKDYLLGVIRSLRYEPPLAEGTAPANYKAWEWYIKNREDSSLFPSDSTQLSENTPEEAAAAEEAALTFREIADRW